MAVACLPGGVAGESAGVPASGRTGAAARAGFVDRVRTDDRRDGSREGGVANSSRPAVIPPRWFGGEGGGHRVGGCSSAGGDELHPGPLWSGSAWRSDLAGLLPTWQNQVVLTRSHTSLFE